MKNKLLCILSQFEYSAMETMKFVRSIRKNTFLFIFTTTILFQYSSGQNIPDKLKQILQEDISDSVRVIQLGKILNPVFFTKPDSCLLYATEILPLVRKSKFTRLEISVLHFVGESNRMLGDFPASLRAQFEALKLSQELEFRRGQADALGFIGITYVDFGDYRQGLHNLFKSLAIHRTLPLKAQTAFNLTNIGYAYFLLHMPDSALYYQRIALESAKALEKHIPLNSLMFTRIGNTYVQKGQLDSAMFYYNHGLENSARGHDKVNVGRLQGQKAHLFFSQEKYDSAMLYARKAYNSNLRSNQRPEQMNMELLLSRLHRTFKQYDSALFYQDLAMAMNDSLYGSKKFKNLQTLLIDEQERKQKIEQEQQIYRSRIRYGSLIAGLIILLLVSSILFRKNRYKQKANIQLIKENKEAQLELLKAQIHPHFLFNTLNNIYSQAQKESPESADMIMELAHILRYVLDETKHELVPLESELQLITDYVNLEKMRYGEGLDLYISFPPNTPDLYITPLMLLPFVENCFKHGTSKVLHNPWINFKIELEENMLSLKLMNGKNPSKATISKRKGTGIENARRRLELLYPGNYELQVIEEEDVFIVNLKVKLVKKDSVAELHKTEMENHSYRNLSLNS